MGTAVAVKKAEKLVFLRDMLFKYKSRIATAAAKTMDVDKQIASTISLVRNTEMWDCDAMSIISCLAIATELGLLPNNILGQVYFVPFQNNKTGKKEAQLIIGYKGLIELARRSGQVHAIKPYIIYEKEPHDIKYGSSMDITHTPLPPSERGEKIIGAYAVAIMRDGRNITEFMWYEEIMKIKATSKAAKSPYSPWNTFEEEMIKKCPIRRLSKYLPLSPELQKAVAVDEAVDAGLDLKGMSFEVDDEDSTAVEGNDDRAEAMNDIKVKELANKLKAEQKQAQAKPENTEGKGELFNG